MRTRPSMYLAPASLDTLASYFQGFFDGKGRPEVSAEFRIFVGDKLDKFKNLAWPQALRASRKVENGGKEPEESELIEEAFALFDEFFESES